MPATRKSTASTASSRSKSRPANQTKLAFSNKVTKSSSHPSETGKKAAAAVKASSPALVKEVTPKASKTQKQKKAEETESELESADTSLASVDLPISLDPIDNEARQVTDSDIKKFYDAHEKGRVAPRVHQSDITISERLLRSWDVDSRYGPCIGIDRTKRWRRAHKFGLNPPIEILAVLLRVNDENGGKEQRAHLDEIMAFKFED